MELSNDKTVEAVGIGLALSFVACIFLEFLFSYFRRNNYVSPHSLITNLIIASLQQVTDIINKGLFLTAFIYVQTHFSIGQVFGITLIKTDTGLLATIINYILVIILADFCQYWLHRLSHEVNIMWAGHITHHSNEEYNLSVAVRQNALEGVYTWVFFMPLAFAGVPWQLFVLAYSISLLWQFLVHTRYIGTLGFLERFMATPSHHRVHHGRNPQYIDKNYGAFLIVWDKLFGTFEPEVEEVDYGITRPISSNNPLWTNIHHHISIFKSAWRAPAFIDKLKVLFGRPAFAAAYDTDDTGAVNTITKQAGKTVYVAVNFITTILSGLWLLNQSASSHDYLSYALQTAVLLSCLSIFVGLLEEQKWADYLEIGRLAILALWGLSLIIKNTQLYLGIATLLAAIVLFFCTWLLALNYKRQQINP